MNPHELTASLYGGSVQPTLLKTLATGLSFDHIQGSCLFVELFFNHLLTSTARGAEVKICLTPSTSMACALHQHGGGVFTIIVPLGVAARLRILARLLLEYWGKERRVQFLNSPLDKIAADNWHVPSRLRPLFGKNAYQDDTTFWEELAALDTLLSPVPETENDVLELQHLALVHLIAHEFTHAWEKHFSILRSDPADLHLDRYNLRPEDLEKCVELHADIIAAELSTRILQSQIALAPEEADADLGRGFVRLAYVVMMLYSLYDPERKYLYAYDEDRYTHPLVRREMTLNFIERVVSIFFPDKFDDLMNNVLYGWEKCIWAVNDMNLDAMSGRFGEIEPNKLYFPIGLAMGGIFSASYIQEETDKASELALRFIALVKDLAEEEYNGKE